jgi:hypothetical protein
MSDVAAALPPGQWAELATGNFNAATLDDGASYTVFYYTEDLAWEPVSRQLLFVGGGHGSDAEFLRYRESTNAWMRSKPGGSQWHASFSHGYDHDAIVPALGKFYFRQPASEPSNTLEIYDIASDTWSRSPAMPGRPACCGAVEYFPELNGLVVVAGPGPVYLFELATRQWRTLSAGQAIGDYHNFAEHSPVHRVMIFGGGEGANGTALFRLDANRQIVRLNNAPQRMGTTYSIVTTDPVSGNFLVFFDTAAYQFNPMTQVWTPLTSTPPWLALGDRGIFNTVATPIAAYGVVLFAKYAGDDSRVYLYRHSTSGAAQPTVDLAADPTRVMAGSFSLLTWSTTDATQCVGSGGAGAWPGNKSIPNGSESAGPLTTLTTFSLSCSGPGGAAHRAASVDVEGSSPGAPTLTLTATPSSVTRGGATQLNWSSANATSCVASGDWSGARAVSGNETQTNLTASVTFTLECSGAAGSVVQSASVTVSGGGASGTSGSGGGAVGWLTLLTLAATLRLRRSA